MNDYLTAEQVARLECLKLVMGRVPTADAFAQAEKMAAFVLNGTALTGDDEASQ